MARSTIINSTSDAFPTLHSTAIIQRPEESGPRVFDVKFYPFPTLDNERIFAICSAKDAIVCRLTPASNPPYEVLRWWKDTNDSSEWNVCAWTKDPVTRKPWLCLAGASPKQIQIFDVETNQRVRSLSGHGKGVDALSISPLSTNLLFSAAEDYTIRVWNLAPEYERQPCVALFAGEGHRQPILTMDIHSSGRWMLTGGLDTAVCMWSIPPPAELEREQLDYQTHPEPRLIYYPVFYSTEVHHNYVDNVLFYGDLVLSRACREHDTKANDILLWKIDGFDSTSAFPDHPPIPDEATSTRSAFPHPSTSRGFQRLLTFDMPYTDRFYQRFCLFNSPNNRPLLAMGNQRSKMFFWDLQTLEEGFGPGEDDGPRRRGRKPKSAVSKPGSISEGLKHLDSRLRRDTSALSMSADGTPAEGTTNQTSTSNSAPPDRKWKLSDPYLPLAPHKKITVETSLLKTHFGTTALAFSPDGLWMVSGGDYGTLAFFRRERAQV